MITELTGKNNQIITIWGRDLEPCPNNNPIWVGTDRPRKWQCTCQCGKTCQGSEFGSIFLVKAKGWEVFDNEAFCSLQCAKTYASLSVSAEVTNLQHKINSLNLRIKELQ